MNNNDYIFLVIPCSIYIFCFSYSIHLISTTVYHVQFVNTVPGTSATRLLNDMELLVPKIYIIQIVFENIN